MWIIRCMVKHKNVCVFIFTDNSEDMLHLSEEGRRNVELLLVVVQLLSRVCLWPPWSAARQASLSFTISWTSRKLMSTESVMPSNHLLFSCPLPLLPSIFSSIRKRWWVFSSKRWWVFSSKSALHIRWPKYCSFSFSISLSNEYSGLVSFRIDWFDLLAVHGILKSLQHHSSKASILQHFSFFMSSSHICTWLLERP